MPRDWGEFLPRAPLDAEDEGKPYFWGSSLDFDDWLRENRPHLRIPEREVVPLDGAIAWTPAHEDPAAEFCPHCRTGFQEVTDYRVPEVRSWKAPCSLLVHRIRPCDFDEHGQYVPSNQGALTDVCPLCRGIDPGSHLFCPKCNGSGFDRRARHQLMIAGIPAPEPPPRPDTAAREAETGDEPAATAPPNEPRELTRRERRALQYGRQGRPGEDDGRAESDPDAAA